MNPFRGRHPNIPFIIKQTGAHCLSKDYAKRFCPLQMSSGQDPDSGTRLSFPGCGTLGGDLLPGPWISHL